MLNSHTFVGSVSGCSDDSDDGLLILVFVEQEGLFHEGNSEKRLDDIFFHFNRQVDDSFVDKHTPLRRQASADAGTGTVSNRVQLLTRSASGSESTTMPANFNERLSLGVAYPISASNMHVLAFQVCVGEGCPIGVFKQKGTVTCSLILGESSEILESTESIVRLSFDLLSTTGARILVATVSEGKCDSSKFYEGILASMNTYFASTSSRTHADNLSQMHGIVLNIIRQSSRRRLFATDLSFEDASKVLSAVMAKGYMVDPLHVFILLGELLQTEFHSEKENASMPLDVLTNLSRVAENFIRLNSSSTTTTDTIKAMFSAYPKAILALKFLLQTDIERRSGPTYAPGMKIILNLNYSYFL
jgi:hypothetical protein